MSAMILVVPVVYSIRYDDPRDKYFIEFVPEFDKWRVKKDSSHAGFIQVKYLMTETAASGAKSLVFWPLYLAAPVIMYDSVEKALEGWQEYIQQLEAQKTT